MRATISRKQLPPAPGQMPALGSPQKALPAALAQLGSALGEFAATQQRRQDTANAFLLFAEFQDAERNYRTKEIYSRTGPQAEGMYTDYDAWFKDAAKQAVGKTTSRGQHDRLNDLLIPYRERQLETVSLKQSAERERTRDLAAKNTLAASIARASEDPGALDAVLQQYDAGLKGIFEGRDVTAELMQGKQQILVAAIGNLGVSNPRAAMDMLELEKYKGNVGAHYDTLHDQLEARIEERLVEETLSTVQAAYPGNWQKQYDAVSADDSLPLRQKNIVLNMIEADERREIFEENRFKAKLKDQVGNEAASLIRAGKFADAMKVVNGSGLESWEKLQFDDMIKSHANAGLLMGAKARKPMTDPNVYDSVVEKIKKGEIQFGWELVPYENTDYAYRGLAPDAVEIFKGLLKEQSTESDMIKTRVLDLFERRFKKMNPTRYWEHKYLVGRYFDELVSKGMRGVELEEAALKYMGGPEDLKGESFWKPDVELRSPYGQDVETLMDQAKGKTKTDGKITVPTQQAVKSAGKRLEGTEQIPQDIYGMILTLLMNENKEQTPATIIATYNDWVARGLIPGATKLGVPGTPSQGSAGGKVTKKK